MDRWRLPLLAAAAACWRTALAAPAEAAEPGRLEAAVDAAAAAGPLAFAALNVVVSVVPVPGGPAVLSFAAGLLCEPAAEQQHTVPPPLSATHPGLRLLTPPPPRPFPDGAVYGTALYAASTAVGGAAAFGLTRVGLRPLVLRLLGGGGAEAKVQRLDSAMKTEGAKIVFLLRLSPVPPITPPRQHRPAHHRALPSELLLPE